MLKQVDENKELMKQKSQQPNQTGEVNKENESFSPHPHDKIPLFHQEDRVRRVFSAPLAGQVSAWGTAENPRRPGSPIMPCVNVTDAGADEEQPFSATRAVTVPLRAS